MELKEVIRFRCNLEPGPAGCDSDIPDLERWREKLRSHGWLGQEPRRYGGLGFGNVSRKLDNENVLISGSQTGFLEKLTLSEYVSIVDYDPGTNWIQCRGRIQPSSETFTHLAIYESDSTARFVFHTHSPEIWRARSSLELPSTHPRFECGTVGLFHAVLELLKDQRLRRKGILAIGGHEDGIMSWGPTADAAGCVLMDFLK
jgi:ribulose-5-phosphate 4-epimerase/fuculose-1-phosphate aldolase